MQRAWDFLKGKKTYVVAAATVALYLLQHAGIQIPGATTVTPEMIEAAILACTIRHGIATS